jgi:hypothetical protein
LDFEGSLFMWQKVNSDKNGKIHKKAKKPTVTGDAL